MAPDAQIEQISKQLSPFFPENAEKTIALWIVNNNVRFKVSKPRQSKLGDYRPPFQGKEHRISVNGNLNIYSFLITTVHEFAHLHTWEEYGSRVNPHGKEWKQNFQKLMVPFIKKNMFPSDITKTLIQHMSNPAASSCSDPTLLKVLQKYDKNTLPYLEDLPPETKFALGNRVFIKGDKQRTRYKCLELNTRRQYLVNGLAQVHVMES